MSYSSLFNKAQDFVKVYRNDNMDSETVAAVIVEFVNTFSSYANGKEFMVTEDLYQASRYSNGEPVRTEDFEEKLKFVRNEMFLGLVSTAINRNTAFNKCDGKCNVSNKEAGEIVDSFISYYMRGKI